MNIYFWSPPSRAAWIEMNPKKGTSSPTASPHSRAAWIEIVWSMTRSMPTSSPPSRAAWIEIWHGTATAEKNPRRRLHGRRGLK